MIDTFQARGLLENIHREHNFEEMEIQGTIPAGLRGTLYRNGVGVVSWGGQRVGHLFEADGALTALRLGDQRATAAARIIESPGWCAERDAGHRLAGDKNTANTHIVPWQESLYALMEGGKPTKVDPDTLAYLGESDFGGVIQGSFSAHPHRVPERRAMVNFGISYGPQITLDMYYLPDDGEARSMGKIPLQHAAMVHDFIATSDYMVFFLSPLLLQIERIMEGLPMDQCFAWEPQEGTEIIVVPLDQPEAFVRFKTEAFFQFHFASATQVGQELVIDYVHYPDAGLLSSLGGGTDLSFHDPTHHVGGVLHRARINIQARSFQTEPLWDGFCEFPRFDDRRSFSLDQALWLQTEEWREGTLCFGVGKFMDQRMVAQHNLEPGQHASEPVFVPHQGSDRASIMVLVYDARSDQSHSLILDAETLTEQARILYKYPIPLRFHGSWLPEPLA